jgi:hypothetical protein
MRLSSLLKGAMAAAMAAGAPGVMAMVNPAFSGVLIAEQQQGQIAPVRREPFLGPAPAPSPVERLGADQVKIGDILVDTAKKEFSVRGVVNDVPFLEFLANTKGGWKSYESALELETNAVNFNVACLLIGLDPAGAVTARQQFDDRPPQGHPVELFVEWDEGGKRRRVRAEQLIYNRATKQTLPDGPWAYTGSTFLDGNRYMAESEGVLVGFMHTPAPIIESPRAFIGSWGDSVINPTLNLKPGSSVTLVLRALPKTPTSK